MKDFVSIYKNLLNKRKYRRWVDLTIENLYHESLSNNIVDVGCGENKISNAKNVIGVDMFPASKDIIKAAADDLPFDDSSIGILTSSHCLEHMANPIKTILEWQRVVGRYGIVWFILPHASRTFDNKRHLTTLEHLYQDFNKGVEDDDKTHWDEFRRLVLLSGHSLIPSDYLEPAKDDNFEFFNNKRLLHHHTWTLDTFIELIKSLDNTIINAIDRVPGREDSFSLICRVEK